MKRQDLQIFLHGQHIGVLSGTSLRLSFQYHPEIVADYGASSILLSLSLPVTRKRISAPEVSSYFDGLLPEGQVRSHLASENGLSTPDAIGLLNVLGADTLRPQKLDRVVAPATSMVSIKATDLQPIVETKQR